MKFIYGFDRHIRALIAVVLVAVCFHSAAQTPNSIDSLRVELSKATTAADSVPLLQNIYDLLNYSERDPVLYQLFYTAERAHDYNSMLEVVFLLTSMHQSKPEMEAELIQMANRVPDSEIKQAHLLFIKMRYQLSNFNRMSEAERQQKLHQALKDYRDHKRLDKYSRIACLFLICTNLRNTADSELLVHYLQQLQDMVEEFPQDELAIRTAFYNLAMSAYISNGLYDKALAATNRTLDLVSRFDKRHELQGRKFRNYDGSLYQCYINMLICAQELSEEEVDMYYNRILDLISRNPRFHRNLALQHQTHIYYLMAKKRYAEAIPELYTELNSNPSQSDLFRYSQALVTAARATGNTEALLKGSKIINNIYRERLESKPDVGLSELQTIYDIDNLKDRNRDLVFENHRIEIDRKERTIIVVVIAVVILTCILIWLISLYLRSRSIARSLSAANKDLVEERNSIEEVNAKLVDVRDKAKVADRIKVDFVENMSSEIREPLGAIVEYSGRIASLAKEDKRPYLRDYAEALAVNTDLLIRLVNDILDLQQIESGELSAHSSRCSVMEICNFALELTRKHVAPGVEVVFANESLPDVTIETDSHLVEQVLIQILANAAKFTEFGSITFGYRLSAQHDSIIFAVTDTGIGIPAGMEEKIFGRFIKADSTTQGNGLGLYVARLLAEILGGSITLDRTYRDGARFIFTIPIVQASK